jgi:hypothetical protein
MPQMLADLAVPNHLRATLSTPRRAFHIVRDDVDVPPGALQLLQEYLNLIAARIAKQGGTYLESATLLVVRRARRRDRGGGENHYREEN